jgi:hypothetical protein
LDCETYRTIDVTASTDPDAAAFCELSLDVDLNCPGDDDTIFDDDTYYDDDTVFDDDTADDDITLSCSDAVTYFYDTCGFAFGGDTGHPADYTKDEALAWCSSGAPDWFAQALACIEQYYGDCDQIGTCYSNIQQSDADYDDAPEQYWQSALMFSVCDLDNDLLPDGAVYIYLAGTTQWFLNTTNPINWSFFNSPPDVDLSQAGDCGAPVQTGVTIGFGPASAPPAAGDYCVDIEATDSAGNFSNKLVNLCVTMASM